MKERGEISSADGTSGVKLIYIDPPFATRQDFKASKEEKAYQDKIAGAKFIEFIRKRLILLRNLLAEDGSIFIHLDQRKIHYIKVIADEVFGEHNFRNEIILPGRAAKNLQQQFDSIAKLNVRHDTLLWYSKSGKTRFSKSWVRKHSESNPNGHWHSFWSTADRPTMRYPLLGVTPETGQWTWKEDRALKAFENHQRFLQEAGDRTLVEYWRDTGKSLQFLRAGDEDGKPQYWRAPSDIQLTDTVWSGVPIYSSSTKYPTEKNEALLSQIIELASSEGDLVLDAFAGSGTTLSTAQKLSRRWIGIDVGKLSIYTIQKRLLNLINSSEILKSNTGFTLYNAGLYDFSKLKTLSEGDWRFFALALFQCDDLVHFVNGIKFDGKRSGDDVLIFDHLLGNGAVLDLGFIDNLHQALDGKATDEIYIIAPAASVVFLNDYIDKDQVRYWILRIPYSIINELHLTQFQAPKQPINSEEINIVVESVGFDFMNQPRVKCTFTRAGDQAYIIIDDFVSRALSVDNTAQSSDIDKLSMILIDFDYTNEFEADSTISAFSMDEVFYANEIKTSPPSISFSYRDLGEHCMIIYIDIFGNEYTEIKSRSDFIENWDNIPAKLSKNTIRKGDTND
nr:site-specific DNA-methyltransferase [Deinococcus humi]